MFIRCINNSKIQHTQHIRCCSFVNRPRFAEYLELDSHYYLLDGVRFFSRLVVELLRFLVFSLVANIVVVAVVVVVIRNCNERARTRCRVNQKFVGQNLVRDSISGVDGMGRSHVFVR